MTKTKPDPPRALVIRPDQALPVKFITRNGKKINDTIDLGYKKVEALEEEIRSFLEPPIP